MGRTGNYSLSLDSTRALKLLLPMKTYDGLKTINRLVALWFPAILLLLLLLIAQTIGGKFGDNVGQAWWWFSQTVLPLTLLLVLLYVRAQRSVYSTVPGTVRWVSISLIVVYFISILFPLLFQPISGGVSISNPKNSTIYLLIFEGLIMTFLGLTFIYSKKGKQQSNRESELAVKTEKDFKIPDGIDTTALVGEYELMVQRDQLKKLQNALVDFSKEHKLPYQDILLSQRNLRQLEKDRLVNIISNENYDLKKAKITNFLLLKINTLKK